MALKGSSKGKPLLSGWLESRLTAAGMSRAALGRLIGRSREEVQRWATGREQIPRTHLIEIALQIATPQDLDYVLRLKDCEDVSDRIDRSLRDLARLTHTDLEPMVAATWRAITRSSYGDFPPPDLGSASRYLCCLADAAFTLRLWGDYVIDPQKSELVGESNIRRHVRNPVNGLMASAINLSELAGDARGSARLQEAREQALKGLLRVARMPHLSEASNFARQHSIHLYLLASNVGDPTGALDEIMSEAADSQDPLMRRLGHASLIIEGTDLAAPRRYLDLLHDNTEALVVDLAFEAVHYGDIALDARGRMPLELSSPAGLIAKLLERITDSDRPLDVREIDIFRLLSAVELGFVSVEEIQKRASQVEGFAMGLAEHFTEEAAHLRRITRLTY